MAKLILSLDNIFLNEFALDKDRTTVGRRPTNDIHIDNLAVSGEHAVVVKVEKDYYVEDLESTNGITVNNSTVKKQFLQQGDVVELGKYQLKFIADTVWAGMGKHASADGFEPTVMIRPKVKKPSDASLVEAKPVQIKPVQEVVNDPHVAETQHDTLTAKVETQHAVEPITKEASSVASVSAKVPFTLDPPALVIPKPTVPVQAATLGVPVATSAKIQVLNGSSAGRELVLNKTLTTLGKAGLQVAVITKRASGFYITHVEGKSFPIVNNVSIGAQAVALRDHDVIELVGVKMEFYFI